MICVMRYLLIAALIAFGSLNLMAEKKKTKENPLFPGNHKFIQLIGRVDDSNAETPRFWAPGVYATLAFEGTSCEVVINDEILWGTKHNYVTLVLDNQEPRRIRLNEKQNVISVGENLAKGPHRLVICKTTEANIGYIELVGIRCKKLLSPPVLPQRRIEFIGNSITCGASSDTSAVPCGAAEWHDQHNAYMAYGPVTSRMLNARWMLSSVSGIGLIHSCCDMTVAMPQVYDKVNFSGDTIAWDFSKYQPDVVSVALGQNDGVQDSTAFCTAYVDFITRLRGYYPSATIICITSPMADANLTTVMQKYLASIVARVNASGDDNVHSYFFSRSYNSGCDWHPDVKEHQLIADELAEFIKKVKNW